jgi:drug/metabolite transporter (DMT)-like permease
MTRRSWIQFIALAALWGASYLFIKVALEDVSPAMVVFVRTALASLVLLPFAIRSHALDALRGRPGTVAALALLQVAAPFMLISIGEQDLSSSLTGILVATAPIFSFLLAIRLEREARAEGVAILGVVLGIAGVALLLGIDAGGGSAALVGGLMVVLASLGYALGAFYLRRNFAGAPPIGVVTGTMGASALMTAPLAALTFPSSVPDLEAFGSLAALGVLGTGIAFILFYTLISEVGPTRTSLVAYVAPGFSVVYGVVLLDESFTLATLAGLVLIIGGSWLAAEARLPWQAKNRVAPIPARPTTEAVR